MVKLIVLKFEILPFIMRLELFLVLFLIFGDLEPRLSYKIVLIKKVYYFHKFDNALFMQGRDNGGRGGGGGVCVATF